MSDHQPINYTSEFKEHLDWVFGIDEGGVPIWERSGTQRVVSMAANIVNGYLITGNRHFCPIMRMQLDNLALETPYEHCLATDQGFVDQWGVYMTRQEAWEVALAAGQIKRVYQEGVLYSECYL